MRAAISPVPGKARSIASTDSAKTRSWVRSIGRSTTELWNFSAFYRKIWGGPLTASSEGVGGWIVARLRRATIHPPTPSEDAVKSNRGGGGNARRRGATRPAYGHSLH